MPRIMRSESNLVPVPQNVSILSNGYVYYNVSNVRRVAADGHAYWDHGKECIGVLRDKSDKWRTPSGRMMYANDTYRAIFQAGSLPERPERDDCVSVGLYAAVSALADGSGLSEMLASAFGMEGASLVLDLAMYMVCEESAVFQHYPHWRRDHAVFSERNWDDCSIGRFEREVLTCSAVDGFREKWARAVLGDGNVYLCYDSTNVNSRARGVFLVQKGYAKDDPSLDQVNTDYVIRQRDGLPVTYSSYPGSVTDISQAPQMLSFLERTAKAAGSAAPAVTVIADRGYVSEENVKALDGAGMGFILMLRRNMGVADRLLLSHAGAVKSSRNYLEGEQTYAITVEDALFDGDTRKRFFHIIWDADLEKAHREALFSGLKLLEDAIARASERRTRLTSDQLSSWKRFFSIESAEEGTLLVGKRGRGNRGKKKEEKSYVVRGWSRNHALIDGELAKCGFYILASSERMSAAEAVAAYRKRDCVEKVFMALKSFLGMDKIGVHSDDAMIGKHFIWFVAAILHALLFSKTEALRTPTNKKSFTTPAVIDLLEEIKCDRNLSTGKFRRRYKTVAKQDKILSSLNLSINQIDGIIAEL